MPNAPSVLHPRLLGSLRPQFYASTVTVESYTSIQDPETGQETRTWGTLTGHGAIPASIAPVVVVATQQSERETDEATWTSSAFAVALSGYYPAITNNHRLRFDDGRLMNIIGVEHDSHLQTTRIKAEEYPDA